MSPAQWTLVVGGLVLLTLLVGAVAFIFRMLQADAQDPGTHCRCCNREFQTNERSLGIVMLTGRFCSRCFTAIMS